jgi:hypothetical protein
MYYFYKRAIANKQLLTLEDDALVIEAIGDFLHIKNYYKFICDILNNGTPDYCLAREQMAGYLKYLKRKRIKVKLFSKQIRRKHEYLIQEVNKTYLIGLYKAQKCPVCETEYITPQLEKCPECQWAFTIYSLTPDGLRQEQENRIEWARELWKQRQCLIQEQLEIEARKEDELKSTINYLLSESTKIEASRTQLLNERQLDWRNSDIDSEIKKVRTFTADLPFKLAETIKNKFPTSERGKNRNTWLNKVIIDAAIKEGLLDTTLYRIESSRVYFALYQQTILYLVLSDYKLYKYTSVDWIIFNFFLNQKSKGKFLDNHQNDIFNNSECLRNFSSWRSEGENVVYNLYEELEDMEAGEFYNYKSYNYKKIYTSVFKMLESYVGEITHYKCVKRGNILV